MIRKVKTNTAKRDSNFLQIKRCKQFYFTAMKHFKGKRNNLTFLISFLFLLRVLIEVDNTILTMRMVYMNL